VAVVPELDNARGHGPLALKQNGGRTMNDVFEAIGEFFAGIANFILRLFKPLLDLFGLDIDVDDRN
jgi:hypothetical protein